MKSISVVIPNYNGKELFEKYFEHNLHILSSLGKETQIIVVDDGSSDDSVSYLEKNYADRITLIKITPNKGFSHACNRGIDIAENDLVFLLNTDVKLEKEYFTNLFRYFELEDTFGVMGRVIGMDDDSIHEAARLPKISGRKIKPSNFFYIPNSDVLTPTFYLSGAIALIDNKKLKELNGFNELFNPFYGEDQELSIRAWRMGWKCYYEHNAICRHEISGSTKGHSNKWDVKKLYFRNRYYIHYLHLNGLDLLLWHIQVIFSDVLMGMFTLQNYKAYAYLAAFQNRRKLKKAKESFNLQLKKQDSKISLIGVIQKLRRILENEQTIKL